MKDVNKKVKKLEADIYKYLSMEDTSLCCKLLNTECFDRFNEIVLQLSEINKKYLMRLIYLNNRFKFIQNEIFVKILTDKK